MTNIVCGDCFEILRIADSVICDGVITSPPYNLGSNPNHRHTGAKDKKLYQVYNDNVSGDVV